MSSGFILNPLQRASGSPPRRLIIVDIGVVIIAVRGKPKAPTARLLCQVKGVHWLERLRLMYLNGILADDMGLGKLLLIMITSCFHLIFMYFILTRQDCPSHRSPFGSLQEERRPGGQTEDPPDQDG